MQGTKQLILLLAIVMINLPTVNALPMDWHGTFGVDSTLLDNYRRAGQVDGTAADDNQIINAATGNNSNASFQSYIFKLNPTIIVNDSASVIGELSTGYGRGGNLGDSSEVSKNGSFGNALYFYNTSKDDANLSLRKMYMELYSDTGTYVLGRQSSHWGLGIVYNSGDEIWDRHSTIRDGAMLKYKIGNFNVHPYYFKIDLSSGGLTKSNNAKEYGINLLYDNPERDLKFGIVFGKKKSKAFNTFFKTDINDGGAGTRNLAETDVRIFDIYLNKSFNKFNLSVEAPFIKGDMGPIYTAGEPAKYKANAVILETKYNVSDSWTYGLNFGWVPGDDGESGTYKAMYLHPNYQIAHIMFRYNLAAISDPSTGSIYDSYVTNTKYAKFFATYAKDTWAWSGAFIYAIAEETAKTGANTYNHQTNETYTAAANQEDDYGYELDLSLDYKWNPNVVIGAKFGYFFVGDYFAFNNTASPYKVDDTYLLMINAAVNF